MTDARDHRAVDPRVALLEQLEYLLVEVAALRSLLKTVPQGLLEAEYMGEPSILEELSAVALADLEQHIPALRKIRGEGESVAPIIDPGIETAEDPVLETLEAMATARGALIRELSHLEDAEWEQSVMVDESRTTVRELAYQITQNDLEVLRSMTRRLHEANLGGAPR